MVDAKMVMGAVVGCGCRRWSVDAVEVFFLTVRLRVLLLVRLCVLLLVLMVLHRFVLTLDSPFGNGILYMYTPR